MGTKRRETEPHHLEPRRRREIRHLVRLRRQLRPPHRLRYTIEPGVVEAAPETYPGYRVDRPVGPIWRVTFSATREGRGDYGASNRPYIFTSRADADAFGKSYFLDVHKRAAKVRKAQRWPHDPL